MVNSRRKGKRGELDLVRCLKQVCPHATFRRSQQYKGTATSADLDTDIPGIHLEAKWREQWSIATWMKVLDAERAPGDVGLLCVRKNHGEWLVVFRLAQLPQLVRTLNGKVRDE